MSPRPYRLGARQAAVAETHERVVATARALFAEGGFHGASVDEVARRADVARATVYHQFGSKLGLLEAVLRDFERRAGLDALAAAIEAATIDALVRTVFAAGCRYWATDPPLTRTIIGLATADPAAQTLLDRHDAGRLALLTGVVDRLVAASELRADCGRERALDVLWLLTSFDAFDQLHRGRNLSADDAAATLADLAEPRLRGHRTG